MLHKLFTASFILLICFAANLMAQKPSRQTETGIVPGIPYASSDIENINLTNGNLNFSFPIGSLPKGRGQATAGMFLKYNSKLWRQRIEELPDDEQGNSRQYTLAHNLDGGWKYGEKYTLKVVNRQDGLDDVMQSCINNVRNYDYIYAWKVQVEFPDGSLHEFRPTGHPIPSNLPSPGVSGTFYNIHPNGQIWNFPSIGCIPTVTQDSNSSRSYYSSDGSFMQLLVNNNLDWEVRLPDGSKITNYGGEQKIYDRNGNFVRWGTVTLPDSTQASGWIDPFDRYTVKKATSTTEDTVYQLGVYGQILKTKIRWKQVTAIKKYRTKCVECGETGHHSSDQIAYYSDRVVDNIQTPDGLVYTFDYYAHNGVVTDLGNFSNGWGEVKSLTMPSQAKTEYQYADKDAGYGQNTLIIMEMLGRAVEKKLFYSDEYDGVTTARQDTWIYSSNAFGGSVTNPDGSTSTQYCYDAESNDELGGYVYKEISPTTGAISEKLWRFNNPPGTEPSRQVNPYVKAEFTTIPNAAGSPIWTAVKEFSYDKNGNVTEVKEYDWVAYSTIPRDSNGQISGLPSGLTPVRFTKNTFYNPTLDASNTSSDGNGYWNVSTTTIRNATASTEVQTGSGTPVSRREIFYDNANTTANPIQTKSWDSSKDVYSNPLNTGNSISTEVKYNQYGMPILTIDAKGTKTQITYGTVGSFSDLYPTQVKTAFGLAEQQISASTYDFYTGLVKTATDVDNGVTNETVYDAYGRPSIQKAAINTASEIWTTTEYNDVLRRIIARSDIETKGDGKEIAIRHFDQLGRVRLARQLENVLTENPYDETHGIKVQTRYLTVNSYSYQLISNPYRAATSAAAINEDSIGWTRSKAINTGKHSEVETFLGATLPAPWGNNAASTGKVQTDVDAERTLVTDQTGKQRISKTNALGQLVNIWEIKESDSDTEAVTFGNLNLNAYKTSYIYNTLGVMTEVTQGIQKRHFLYDSLGRMLRVRQPEQQINSALNLSGSETTNTQWTAGFSYDNNGNVLTAIDAKNLTITSIYDALNRPLTKSYSDGITPLLTFTYDDANVPYSKGKLTKISSTISEMRYRSYDIMGRLLSSEQVTDGQTYSSSYKYNLAGMLTEQTYPSGRVVKEFLMDNGKLSGISSKVWNGQFKTYATNINYTATGVIKHLQIGNGLWESAKLNSRQQVTELNLGTSPTDGSKWQLKYDYGEFDANGTVDATRNSGNIAKQTISFSGLTQPFVQTYKYDSLDRITEAKETNNGNQTWKQNWGYDRYGNRTGFTQDLGGQQLSINNLTLPAVDRNTNRFQTGQGYQYDADGNLTQDAEGRQFTFDGENKQTEVRDASNNVVGRYYYDGNGKRVKKVTSSETIVFVYDGFGKLAAEYSTAASVQNPTTNYTATDPLGSPRVITNKLGEIVSRRDFMPFGEQLAPDPAYRTANLKYNNADNLRQKFTGYEHDEETQLDFAEARYYNDNHGRFTAVDPLLASGKSANPQTFNRYVYTMNRPLILTDSTGLQAGTELKRDFGLSGYTYQPIIGKRSGRYEKTPDGPIIEIEPAETVAVGEKDIVYTSNEVNETLNKYASAVYTNEFNANSAIGAKNEASGVATVESVELGTGIDFGIKGKDAGNVSGDVSVGVKVKINNTEDIDAQRRDADTKLNGDARNKLRNLQTVTSDSPDKPIKLTDSQISGLLRSAAKTATDAARTDVAAAEEDRRNRERINPPR